MTKQRVIYAASAVFIAVVLVFWWQQRPVSVSPSPSIAASVSEFTLDNGLKLIVKEDHRAPVVVAQIWYKVGSSYEHDGITGVSHILEHMMFKGTQAHPAGEFSRIIAEQGGRENAFTGRDYTAYFQQLEKSRLPISFELEADRMRGLLLPSEEFDKERKVVMEERRLRTEDKPQSLTYERFNSVAFQTNPYRTPVIGWMNDLENLNVEDLRTWYQHWYAPNNATLVVAGDVDPKEVYQLAKQFYGPVPRREVHTPKPRRSVVQQGIKRITVKRPAKLPYLIMGYQVPVVKTAQLEWEPYALEVAAYLLAGDDSSRFARNLVRGKQVAASVDTSYDPFSRVDNLFIIDAVPSAGVDVAQMEKHIREQLLQLRDQDLNESELQKIKTQAVAAKVYERDSVFYQAMQIGQLETVGLDWRLADRYVERIKAVTPQQVQEVVAKYFIDDHLTVAVLEPLPTEAPAATPAQPGGPHEDVR